MNKENLNLFQQIVQAHNITCTIVEKDFSNLYKTDLELRYKLYSDYTTAISGITCSGTASPGISLKFTMSSA